MNVLIIEDEKLAAERMARMLRQIDPSIYITGSLDTIGKAVSWLQKNNHPDLILLDIHLGDGKSFDILEKVDLKSHIIFITAYDKYAIKAFKYNSIDYLLKPLKMQDLQFAYNKFQNQFASREENTSIPGIIRQLNKATFKSRFLVRQASMLISINTEEVAFVYTRDRSHFIKTHSGIDYTIDNNLDELEEQLDPLHFFRVNRQFIVRFSAIDKVVAWFDNKIKLHVKPIAYEEIIISRLRAGDFKKWLDK